MVISCTSHFLCPFILTDPATSNVDYTSGVYRVVFQPGDTIQYVNVPISVDGRFERTEYFNVDLAITSGSAGSIGNQDEAVVLILEEGEGVVCLN